MNRREQVGTIVIGAGHTGLAVGYHLSERACRTALLMHPNEWWACGGNGGTRCVCLPPRDSGLPGVAFPADPWVVSDQGPGGGLSRVYAKRHDLNIGLVSRWTAFRGPGRPSWLHPVTRWSKQTTSLSPPVHMTGRRSRTSQATWTRGSSNSTRPSTATRPSSKKAVPSSLALATREPRSVSRCQVVTTHGYRAETRHTSRHGKVSIPDRLFTPHHLAGPAPEQPSTHAMGGDFAASSSTRQGIYRLAGYAAVTLPRRESNVSHEPPVSVPRELR